MMTVGDLLKRIMPRLSGPSALPFLDALNIAVNAVVDRLHANRSSLLRTDVDEDYLASSPTITLSSGFLGFYTQPWIEGQNQTLLPLLPGTKYAFTQEGLPLYYEERNKVVTLYPTPSEDGTFRAEIFERPDALTSLGDDVPFDGDYDQAIQEISIFVLRVGAMVAIDPAFDAFVRSQVDAPSHRRMRKGIFWQYPA